jgi:hypothetical protein
MLILKIAAALLLLAGAFEGLARFAMHFEKKFGHRPWSAGTTCLWQLYGVLLYDGWLWMLKAAEVHGNIWSGLLVAGGGAVGACWLLVTAYRRSSLLYASAAIVLQLALSVIAFPPLSIFWLIADQWANRDPSAAPRQRRDDNKAGLSGYRPKRIAAKRRQ